MVSDFCDHDFLNFTDVVIRSNSLRISFLSKRHNLNVIDLLFKNPCTKVCDVLVVTFQQKSSL